MHESYSVLSEVSPDKELGTAFREPDVMLLEEEANHVNTMKQEDKQGRGGGGGTSNNVQDFQVGQRHDGIEHGAVNGQLVHAQHPQAVQARQVR